jgi:hypothetical protein
MTTQERAAGIAEVNAEYNEADKVQRETQRKIDEFIAKSGIVEAKKTATKASAKINRFVKKFWKDVEKEVSEIFIRHFPELADNNKGLRYDWITSEKGYPVYDPKVFSIAYAQGRILILRLHYIVIPPRLSGLDADLYRSVFFNEGITYTQNTIYFGSRSVAPRDRKILPKDKVDAFMAEVKAILPERISFQLGEEGKP